MHTEYEATYWPINKDELRTILSGLGAEKLYAEHSMRRYVFHVPMGSPLASSGAWVRVRDEGDKTTLSIKQITNTEKIEGQKELEIVISDFETGTAILKALGCAEKAFQETKRELWMLNDVQITLDEWPFLEPFVEIEGTNEEQVRTVCEQLGYDWSKARFCAADTLYAEKYGIREERINSQTPRIAFNEPNPFL